MSVFRAVEEQLLLSVKYRGWSNAKYGLSKYIYIRQAHASFDQQYIYLNGINKFHDRMSVFFLQYQTSLLKGQHACNQTVNVVIQ